jgi:polysaccharide pyruvyl transferase WcaK-like protein
MSQIVITGITSCESRGVETLARSIATQLIAWTPGKVTVLTQTPDLDAASLNGTGACCVADPFVVSRAWKDFRPAESLECLDERKSQLLREADLVIGTGGDLYTSDYGVSGPYLRALIAAQRQGVATAMLGQSVGPFADDNDARQWSAVALGCDVLTMRESVTRQYVVDELGLPEEHVRLSSDPGFLLPSAPIASTESILARLGLTVDRPYICVAPSQGITRFSGLAEDEHLAALLRLVRELADGWRLPVLLVPHCHDSRAHNDDRILAARVAAESGRTLVMAVTGSLGAMDYKGLLGHADLVIAERLHAAISALSSGTPAIAIGHSAKFNGVLTDTYGDTISADSVHLDVRAFTRDASVIPRLIRETDRAALRRTLRNRLPLVVGRAQEDFTLLKKLISQNA